MSKILKAIHKETKNVYIFKSYKDKIGYSFYIYKTAARRVFRSLFFCLAGRTDLEGFRFFNWEKNNFEISEPSQQEIDHLEACIKANKYIPIEEILTNKEFSYEVW